MRQDSMVSRYAIPIGIPQVDGWSMGSPSLGRHILLDSKHRLNRYYVGKN